ncbi:SpoIID/LytB domain-containing protein [uncultured Sunxiuqinia sp.]|uniref:SpoIID/LytB domain-containing protein n=1 Tax=uncultured Sunxiuqinia sp. TaxID=1573825 RepID=UPI002AA60753|nr:SpoIID/LytB domain-containing protein [uncultured Sunxiuqinia sp.]
MTVQPTLQVGIMAEETISFELSGDYTLNDERCESYYQATIEGDLIIVKSKNEPILSGKEFIFHSNNIDDSFLLEQVTIGINFHWEQTENQRFRGNLKLLIENDKVRAVNVVPLEEYLRSVISSEMSASSSTNLLKAHAVISRSWLLAQMEKSEKIKAASYKPPSTHQNKNELISWYDREDHQLFDVCSDDHCQRYQGISKIISEKASQAIDDTKGEVLVANGEICDARFSKCCGGVSENFENVWEPVRHSYLTKIVDSEQAATTCIDLRQEEEAEDWIRDNPSAFCNTNNKQILSQVLPDFDQKTVDFYRWQISYLQQDLSALLQKKNRY